MCLRKQVFFIQDVLDARSMQICLNLTANCRKERSYIFISFKDNHKTLVTICCDFYGNSLNNTNTTNVIKFRGLNIPRMAIKIL